MTRDELVSRGVAWLAGHQDRIDWTFVWERLVELRKSMTALQCERLRHFGYEWLTLPTHRLRSDWDRRLENWIDAGGDDDSLLLIAAEWIMKHRVKKQVPPLAAKVLRATRQPAEFDHVAAWLTEWCRANPNAGQSKFVVGFLRTEQGKGWTPASDTSGWKTLLNWLAPRPRRR